MNNTNCIHFEVCKEKQKSFMEYHAMEALFDAENICIKDCRFFDDKTGYCKLPAGVMFEHSEELNQSGFFSREYEWRSIYRLKITIAGTSDNLEDARHKMSAADEDFLKKYPIPYKEVWNR